MNPDNHLRLDIAAAVVIALIVLIVSPGAAVDAILVLILLVICGVGALWSRRGRRGGLGLGSRLRALSAGREPAAGRRSPAGRRPRSTGSASRSAERTRARSPRGRR